MPIYKGTQDQKYMNFRDKNTDAPIDITGWTFRADLRDQPDDPSALATLTTANGGIAIMDGLNGRIAFVFSPLITDALPVGRIHFDVLRDNAPGGPQWLFGGKFLVREPITRS